jgi:hypothetical protein
MYLSFYTNLLLYFCLFILPLHTTSPSESGSSRAMVRNIFRTFEDTDGGGGGGVSSITAITALHLKNFVLSPELGLFTGRDEEGEGDRDSNRGTEHTYTHTLSLYRYFHPSTPCYVFLFPSLHTTIPLYHYTTRVLNPPSLHMCIKPTPSIPHMCIKPTLYLRGPHGSSLTHTH